MIAGIQKALAALSTVECQLFPVGMAWLMGASALQHPEKRSHQIRLPQEKINFPKPKYSSCFYTIIKLKNPN